MTTLEHQFKTIYEANYPKVIRLCLGYNNGDVSLSKDLAQDVFIKVWQNLESFRNQSNISTWIYRIAVNTCLLELRKKKNVQLSSHLHYLEDSSVDFEENKPPNIEGLYRCINTLKAENKSIILLELEGLPQKQIAEVMGLSHEVIRVRIHRIKNELTKCIKQ